MGRILTVCVNAGLTGVVVMVCAVALEMKTAAQDVTFPVSIELYIDGFRKSDHAQILSCLTDDVEWDIPGMFHAVGKEAFDQEIENEAFLGSPTLTITRMTEENDVVIAEGTVQARKRKGGFLNAVFCDAFTMRDGKIKHLISYLMELNVSGKEWANHANKNQAQNRQQ